MNDNNIHFTIEDGIRLSIGLWVGSLIITLSLVVVILLIIYFSGYRITI